MEVSALKYSGGIGLHGRSPLLRLQSDERLVAFIRKGNGAAFEALVARYESRLLAFCRHLLGSREDAEDVLQEVLAAAFNALLADNRPINVRPWLYRIARNRSLNHLRRIQAVGVDSMDVHLSEHGASTADKVHEREEFRLLVGDIHELPETQKTALVLREMDALTYEQIAEAMETTVPSVKSLLVRARVSLAEAAEARLLSCEEVRIELAEVAEGLRRRPNPLVRRHLRACKRCSAFRTQLKMTNKALAALLPVGPLMFLKKLALTHLGHSAGAGSGATVAAGSGAAGTGAAGSMAAAGSTVVAGSTTGGFVSAGIGAIATKAAAGLAAAALVTAGAVEVDHSVHHHARTLAAASVPHTIPRYQPGPAPVPAPANEPVALPTTPTRGDHKPKARDAGAKRTLLASVAPTKTPLAAVTPANGKLAKPPGHTDAQSDPTVLPSTSTNSTTAAPPTTPTPGPATPAPTTATASGSTSPVEPTTGTGVAGAGTTGTTGTGTTGTGTTGTGTGGGGTGTTGTGTGTGTTGTGTTGTGTGTGTTGTGTGNPATGGGTTGTGPTGTADGPGSTGAAPSPANSLGGGTPAPLRSAGDHQLSPPPSGG